MTNYVCRNQYVTINKPERNLSEFKFETEFSTQHSVHRMYVGRILFFSTSGGTSLSFLPLDVLDFHIFKFKSSSSFLTAQPHRHAWCCLPPNRQRRLLQTSNTPLITTRLQLFQNSWPHQQMETHLKCTRTSRTASVSFSIFSLRFCGLMLQHKL